MAVGKTAVGKTAVDEAAVGKTAVGWRERCYGTTHHAPRTTHA